jgi:hypothetical protein
MGARRVETRRRAELPAPQSDRLNYRCLARFLPRKLGSIKGRGRILRGFRSATLTPVFVAFGQAKSMRRPKSISVRSVTAAMLGADATVFRRETRRTRSGFRFPRTTVRASFAWSIFSKENTPPPRMARLSSTLRKARFRTRPGTGFWPHKGGLSRKVTSARAPSKSCTCT